MSTRSSLSALFSSFVGRLIGAEPEKKTIHSTKPKDKCIDDNRNEKTVPLPPKTFIYPTTPCITTPKPSFSVSKISKLSLYSPRPSSTPRQCATPNNAKCVCIMCVFPAEITMHIFSYLDADELCVVSMVCKEWMNIAYDEGFWQSLYLKRWKSFDENVFMEKEVNVRKSYIQRHEKEQPEILNMCPYTCYKDKTSTVIVPLTSFPLSPMTAKKQEKVEKEQEQYEIEYIHKMRVKGGVKQYKVHWKGFPCETDDTWDTEKNLIKAGYQPLIQDYMAKIKTKQKENDFIKRRILDEEKENNGGIYKRQRVFAPKIAFPNKAKQRVNESPTIIHRKNTAHIAEEDNEEEEEYEPEEELVTFLQQQQEYFSRIDNVVLFTPR
eukprot:TRINITY_DN3291_c0_g1_i1.p1 TRINITY_DN3291_c0_g1~~TRINITY_DN3291_c0_g1_i1.p1  ORF type:complete len:380 (+),score=80.53 TRINITY_DN3291_c0_g1_i1:1184-2323(+)